MTVMTTWTSLRRPLMKVGRSGRSISRQVRIASSDGRPSRRKNEPGMRPAAYIRSSTSTVSGKKSNCSLRVLAGRGGRQQHGVVVEVGDDGAGGLLGQPAGLEADGAGAEAAVVDDGFGELDLGTARMGRLRVWHGRSRRAGLLRRRSDGTDGVRCRSSIEAHGPLERAGSRRPLPRTGAARLSRADVAGAFLGCRVFSCAARAKTGSDPPAVRSLGRSYRRRPSRSMIER